MKKKKLGKLELKKERIANLNDSEMNNIQGGVTVITPPEPVTIPCSPYYPDEPEESWYNCDDQDTGGTEYVVYGGCLIDEVVCNG